MPDLENVIDELKAGIEDAYHRCHCGLAVTMENALSLLKAQEPIVRCKDCRYSRDRSDVFALRPFMCLKTGEFHDGDWYCAAGESGDVG